MNNQLKLPCTHHWILDCDNFGICRLCDSEFQFPTAQEIHTREDTQCRYNPLLRIQLTNIDNGVWERPEIRSGVDYIDAQEWRQRLYEKGIQR